MINIEYCWVSWFYKPKYFSYKRSNSGKRLEDHDKWLMIVDDNGKVVEIYKVGSTGRDANVTGTINIGDYRW